jgi:hypothetical protein
MVDADHGVAEPGQQSFEHRGRQPVIHHVMGMRRRNASYEEHRSMAQYGDHSV